MGRHLLMLLAFLYLGDLKRFLLSIIDKDGVSDLSSFSAAVADGDFPSFDVDISESCPPNQIYFGGKCYFYDRGETTMSEAEGKCRQIGYSLVVVDNDEENTFLQGILRVNKIVAFWLGIKKDGEWLTSSSRQKVKYTHWYPTSDLNFLKYDCALIDHRGMWKNYRCDEYQASTMCESQASHYCPESAEVFRGKHYLFGAHTIDMRKAETICRDVGYNLVVINNAEENSFVQNIIVKNNLTAVWMGIKRVGNWIASSSKQALEYTHWHPDAALSVPQADCAFIDRTGMWRNVDCGTIIAITMCESQASHDCPENVEVFRGKRYLFGAPTVDLTSSMDACGFLDYHYVVVDDAEENNFIRDIIIRKKLSGAWVGLYWVYPFAVLADMERPRYINWAPGNPIGNPECVYMDRAGYWRNIMCSDTTHAAVMCEKDQ